MRQKIKEWVQKHVPASVAVVLQLVILWVCAAVIVYTLTGCKSKKHVIVDNSYKRDTCYIERRVVDTLITVEADTALTRLLVECDERSNALVAIIDQQQGERVTSSSLIKYVMVRDTITNELRRQAYIDVQAYAAELQSEVRVLEEKIAQGKTENKELKEQLEKQPKNGFLTYVLTFVLGLVIGGGLVLYIKK